MAAEGVFHKKKQTWLLLSTLSKNNISDFSREPSFTEISGDQSFLQKNVISFFGFFIYFISFFVVLSFVLFPIRPAFCHFPFYKNFSLITSFVFKSYLGNFPLLSLQFRRTLLIPPIYITIITITCKFASLKVIPESKSNIF